jgi:hypothetical protein
MADYFEDHCWKDVIPADVIELYSHYKRETFVGPRVALLAIDLYKVAYRGGAKHVMAVAKEIGRRSGTPEMAKNPGQDKASYAAFFAPITERFTK